MQEDLMEIRMFGGFLMKWKGRQLASTPRTKKVWLLLEYLVLMRNQTVQQEDLAHLLWNQEECDHPATALKNLVYRARNLLKILDPDVYMDFILFQDGRYFWNPHYPCEIDCEKMESLYLQSQEGLPDQRIEKLQQAIDLYQGDFLPLMSYSEWATVQRKYFERIYLNCILRLGELYQQQQRINDWIQLGEWAVQLYPNREQIQIMLMQSYLNAGNRQKALAYYNTIAHHAENDHTSAKLQNLYANIVAEKNNIEFDLSSIREILHHDEQEVGAFYCTFDIFRNIYRLQTRVMLREGRHLYIGLLSIGYPDGLQINKESKLQVIEAVKETLIVGLRRGDVISQYTENQFVMMLPLRDKSYGNLVMDRLKKNFFAIYPSMHIDWNVCFSRMEPIEETGGEQ
ncbi:MAG: AfsR/SARP family transcriptional regulator [Candidatus Merdivicinus sp.]|jgi:DNA-binding SARP family transcriptional activator